MTSDKNPEILNVSFPRFSISGRQVTTFSRSRQILLVAAICRHLNATNRHIEGSDTDRHIAVETARLRTFETAKSRAKTEH